VHARLTASLLALQAVIALSTASASADPPAPPPSTQATPPPTVDPPFPGAIPEGDIPPRSLVWHPWRLFDPYLSPRAIVLSGAMFDDRQMRTDIQHDGFSLAAGRSIESDYGYVFIRAQMQYGFRLVGEKEFAADLGQFAYTTGLALGPLEIYGRAGLTAADLYLGKGGFGLGFLSPKVGAGVSINLGKLRVGALATSELAWRWLGGPSEQIHSLVLDLALNSGAEGLPYFYRIGSDSPPRVE
jgi:hypothetical protein